VARVLGEIDIFVLPSRTEALSNALMEAMACGCACIASNVGGNPELIRAEETGLLFEAGDSTGLATQLRRLTADEPLRRRLAGAGQDFIRANFSLAASARRMGEIYDNLMRAGRV
jgi:glycosyltransferase involved in cell wall biosynthesis